MTHSRVQMIAAGLLCIVLAPLSMLFAPTLGAQEELDSDVQRLLQNKCGKCHSQKVRKGDLDLSTLASIRRGGESGDPMIGQSLEESLLWTHIADGMMPPDGEPELDAEQTRQLRDWITTATQSQHALSSTDSTPNQHDVLPILLLRCVTCHGAQRQDGGLDLRRVTELAGGDGPVIVAGNSANSPLIQRIESEACPPRELLLKFFVRRPPRSEVDVLKRWIDAGAPIADVTPDVATEQPDPLVTDQDRQHWAFQPLQSPTGQASLDQFVQIKHQQHGLEFATPADRQTLIRRAYIDLIGIPPSITELERWQTADEEKWYELMIDHLLGSPHYGERWGRYWLDLAGYADSEGGISADPIRPVAWKYRDYVIRAFNDDKPYDKFLLEQIAGDELLDHENAEQVTDQMVQNLIATGFLRMGIDETGSRTMNFVPERLKVISDAITVVSSGVMGLTMECARCHSHKYDPIPHRDYYRFKAIFQGALDEHDWKSFKTRKLQVATPRHQQRIAEINPPLEKQLKQLTNRQKKLASDVQLEMLRHHYPDQSEQDNQRTLQALKKADNNRTLQQKMLVERLQRVEVLPEHQQPKAVLDRQKTIARTQKQIDHLRRQLVAGVNIRALWDFGQPSPTYILRRGEHDKPGRLVGPGVPSVLTDGKTPFEVQPPFPHGTPKSGRRLALAKWLTRPDHPLTARVMVNRIWYHHFGTGLVKDLENFGVKGSRPSHPLLLDWLAAEFIRRDWSIKEMHRLIMTSQTYRQSSLVTPVAQQRDPENQWLSRMPLRRLDAESLRDSILFIAGKLDVTQGGIPDPVSVDREGLVSANPTKAGLWRRSVYLQYRRTEIPTMMDTFDYPQMGPNCVARSVSTVSPQSLILMNNSRVRFLAGAVADRVRALAAKESATEHVDWTYRLILSREANRTERELGVAALAQLADAWPAQPEKALETYCHTILNSAAFLYVD